MVFGPGTSEPIADEGLLLGLLQIASILSGHATANALSPHTLSNSARYGRCDILCTTQAGSGFVISPQASASPEQGLPLLQECVHAFFLVGAVEQLNEGFALQSKRRFQRHVLAEMHNLLDGPDR